MNDNPINLRMKVDWTLCCFCQGGKKENLNHPYEKACYHQSCETIEKDIIYFLDNKVALPHGMIWECLIDDGKECISKSLLKRQALNHKTCCNKIRPHTVQCILKKRGSEEMEASCSTFSPKKTRKSFFSNYGRKQVQCVYCSHFQDYNSEPICKAMTLTVSKNLKGMAKEAQNWSMYAQVNEAFDATAGDIYYHKSCYHKLANAARAAKLKKSKVTTTSALPYDPFVMAKLISNVQNNESVMKLTDLRKFYSQQLQQVDSDCLKMEIPPTRFKEHLLMNLGDEWQAFTKGRDVLLSTKSKTSSLLSDSLTQDVSEDKAKKIVEVALLL